MIVKTDLNIKNDLNDIARLFETDGTITVNCHTDKEKLYTELDFKGVLYKFDDKIITSDNLIYKRLFKRYAKKHLYDVLKSDANAILPWGSLTGIRPVKLYGQTMEESGNNAEEYFKDFYDVSQGKIELVKEIYNTQNKVNSFNYKAGLYIGIPFCKGRCSYCSFFSADIEKNNNLILPYVNALIEEIKCVLDLLKQNKLEISSIYVGGGTPSSLPIELLENILKLVKDIPVKEFTVEAGRPDSINKELLNVLKANNVTRISINPQTVNDNTLKIIGRRHTFEDFINAFEIAKNYNFIINTDIIAGLPQEEYSDFVKTVDSVIKFKPQNITVHTLALKQGANLKIAGYRHGDNVNLMLDYAAKKLHNFGYGAYYMYRQKNTAGNLENTGFSLDGYECLYNIDNMSDKADIFACGADAVSKRVFSKGRIERQGNPKDILTYCNNIDKIKNNKINFITDKR